MRTALTLLGIVIGSFTVVAMMGLTEGLRLRIAEDMTQLGAGVFQVQKWPAMHFGGNRWWEYARRKNLTPEHVDALRRSCEECQRVGGEVWEFAVSFRAGNRYTASNFSVAGGTIEF